MSLFDDDDIGTEDLMDAVPLEGVDGDVTGLKPPRENEFCFGHEGVEQTLLKLFNADRLPHAMIFAGPVGIGKSTFAYRLARFLMTQPADGGLFGGDEAPAENFSAAMDNPAVRRIASGGHADVLTVGRVYDEKRRGLSNDVPVSEVRKVTPFLSKTASEGGWRIVILDDAHRLNRSSQNAILKILEEPPKKTVLILIADQPGRFLPTIRSRCQIYTFSALSDDYMRQLLSTHDPSIAPDAADGLIALSHGRIGRAIELQDQGGLAVYGEVMDLLARLPEVDALYGYELSEIIGKDQKKYDLYVRILRDTLSMMALNTAKGLPPRIVEARDVAIFERLNAHYSAKDWLDRFEAISALIDEADRMYLDKQQAMHQIIWALETKAKAA